MPSYERAGDVGALDPSVSAPGPPPAGAPALSPQARAAGALARPLSHPRLAAGLIALAWVLSSPALFLGFYLDDHIGRYLYSDLPDADRLRDVLSGGYGVANGVPADTHWQIEQGYAPWWTDEHLLLALLRPVGMAAHQLDMSLWPDSPLLMRLHSFLWLGLLIVLVTRLQRRFCGLVTGGLAALLFAMDHTHGFSVGYITNRHALIGAVFAVACLDQHVRARTQGRWRHWAAALICYAVALLSSEASISIMAYLFGYALFIEPGPWRGRALRLLPYLAVTVVWRLYYSLAGYGARGSGLYIDPLREPLSFVQALASRVPLLVNGLFWAPPAEIHALLPSSFAGLFLLWAILWSLLLLVPLVPLLRRKPAARMWALGMFLSLIPASGTIPHNRQLLLSSIGAMGLLAQLWELFVVDLHGQRLTAVFVWAKRLGALFLGMHLVTSPLLLPLATCSSGLLGPLQRGMVTIGDEIAGRDVVFVTAPDYLAPKVVLLSRRVAGRPLPRRTRALSFGPVPVTARRVDARSLVLDYEGGILQTPLMELYRDRREAMAVGDTVQLQGLTIEVLQVSADGRPTRVRFTFDRALDDPMFRFYAWGEAGFAEWRPPPIGQQVRLPAAALQFGFE